MEEESGNLSPISSTASTAVEHQTNGQLFQSPQKSPVINGAESSSSSLAVPRRNKSTRLRERRSFSSAQKLPVLEPSSSPIRRRFDFILLWLLQTLTLCYLHIAKLKHRLVNFACGIWYDWHAWPWCGKYMIQRDVANLGKIPRHVAVILDERKMTREYDADETVRRAVEIATWCACAGISIVTLYEFTGLLKKDVKKIQRNVQKMTATYLHKSSPHTIDVRTPQSVLLTNGFVPDTRNMEILVISHEDSRLPIVDLARTLGDMTKQDKLFPEDISIDLIHENLTGTL